MNQFDRLFTVSGLSLDRLRSFLEVAEAGNIAKAAKADPTRQSQFSRQVKELEGFFGVALTRRVGRRIEITEDGHRLAAVIRRHFSELDDFRESMSGRPVRARLGAAASVLEWLVIPKLEACMEALGGATLELDQSRSAEVVRGVVDGRLDFGIVREDAVPREAKRWKLGSIGYSLFAPKAAWKKRAGIHEVIGTHPMADLLPGGQFHEQWSEWIASQGLRPKVVVRVGSFIQAASLVRQTGLCAVLPDHAAIGFDSNRIGSATLPWRRRRQMVLIANARSLDRAGLRTGATALLSRILAWRSDLS